MKSLARSCVWLSTLNSDIEIFVQSCSPCARVNFKKLDNQTYPWPAAKGPFERVHIDFYQFQSVNFLLYVDAYSKWFYVVPMLRSTAEAVISVLLSIFAFWGLPKKLVSDNGPPFSSKAYKQFCTNYDIELCYSPVSHPECNAQAERSVQICKKALLKLCSANPDSSATQWQDLISRFLLCYLNTPTTTHNKTPNQLLIPTFLGPC